MLRVCARPLLAHSHISQCLLDAGDYQQTLERSLFSCCGEGALRCYVCVLIGFYFENTILAHGAAAPVVLHPRPIGLQSVIIPPTGESDGSGARELLKAFHPRQHRWRLPQEETVLVQI